MVDKYSDIRDAIRAEVRKAANRRQSLHTGQLAADLMASHPDCGMTLGKIENEIVLEVGRAGGSAQTDHRTAKQQAG